VARKFAILVLGLLAAPCAVAWSQSWVFRSGDYTHDPESGKRVNQYEELPMVGRIPYHEYFSEEGPDPYGMDYWSRDPSWYGAGWFDSATPNWTGYSRTSSYYPLMFP
jgi:hypothetical protein